MLRTITATRYVTPLREGGSLPAIVEADDDGSYVLKFRGAGQGAKALIAELVAGEIGRALGLPVPEIVLMELDPILGRSEPDYEIRRLITSSAGLNLALDYLPGSLTFDPAAAPPVDQGLASAIVWFDGYVTNVDRTARNTNMLLWHKQLWLIDHGAALYFHHNWNGYMAASRNPFPAIRDHVLLSRASQLAVVDAGLRSKLTPSILTEIIAAVPDGWLEGETDVGGPDAVRSAYLEYLTARLEASSLFVEEALNARSRLV
jgi:hypothetical protein